MMHVRHVVEGNAVKKWIIGGIVTLIVLDIAFNRHPAETPAISVFSTEAPSPMPWETLDHSKPIFLSPWGFVCRTVKQMDTTATSEDGGGPGCTKPRSGQVPRVTWLGPGPEGHENYQRVAVDFGKQKIEGWTLGTDIYNEK